MARPFLLVVMAGVVGAVLDPESAAAQALKMAPVDEAPLDPSFVAYRNEMLQGIRARDTELIVSLASEDIKLSFGGDVGRETLRRNLEGSESWQGDAYWRELQHVMDLGGVFLEDGAFCSPYLACLDVPGCATCDPYETVFVTGRDVPARERPDPDARIVERFTYDVLRLDPDASSGEEWYPVHLPGGGRAFISRADARMAIDHRARFEKIGGRWLMTVFIAGD